MGADKDMFFFFFFLLFFFNDTATTEIYTLSLHDALPIYLAIMRLNNSMIGQLFLMIIGLIGIGTIGW